MTVGAEKSHDLPTASWRPGKADGVIQSEPEGPRTRGSNSQGHRKVDVPAQAESEGTCPFSAHIDEVRSSIY